MNKFPPNRTSPKSGRTGSRLSFQSAGDDYTGRRVLAGRRSMPSRYTEAASALANSAAILATPRKVARYLRSAAMGTLVELVWRSQLRSGDLTAALTDHFVGEGATVVDIGASWGLFSYHLARLVGGGGRVLSSEPHPMNRPVLEKLARARPNVRFRPAAVSDLTGSAGLQVPVFGSRHVTAQSSLAHGFDGQRGGRVEKVTVPTGRLDGGGGDRRSGPAHQYLPHLLIEIEQRPLDGPIGDVFAEIGDIGYALYFIDGPALRPV